MVKFFFSIFQIVEFRKFVNFSNLAQSSKIASGAEYQMDEQFEKLIFEISLVFQIEKNSEFVDFPFWKMPKISSFEKSKKFG